MLNRRPLLSRALLIALFALPAGATLMDSAPAQAQSASMFSNSAGFAHLLAPSAILGDGSTSATLYVLALNPDGTPMTGMKGRIGASQGGTTDLEDQGQGLYRFTYTPPAVATPTKVEFTLKAKSSTKATLNGDFNVTINPQLPSMLTATSSPTELVLGQDQAAALNIKLTGLNGAMAGDGGKLLVHTEYGSVEALTYLGGGTWTARYVPKNVNYPHLDLLTFADARNPEQVYGTHVVSMVGKTDFPITNAPPNSTLMLRIGDRDFGPYTADTAGKAVIPVTVPPGLGIATRITIVDGKQTEEPFDLQLPKTRRLALFPMANVPGDGVTPTTVRIAVRTPIGAEDANAKVSLAASSGSVTQPVHQGNGIYTAQFTPVRSAKAGTATLTASLAGESGKSEVMVNLAGALPDKLDLTPEPTTLAAGAAGFKVYAKVTDAKGIGVEGVAPVFVAAGAKESGAARDLKSGDYQSAFNTVGADSVVVTALGLGAASGNPASRVVVLPSSERVTNDGKSTVVVSILSVDQFGYPVADQAVTLRLNTGDGRLPSEVRTDSRGLATVTYAAGTNAGAVDIEARSGDLYGGATLIQAPANVQIDLPISGSQVYAQQDARLQRLVQTVVIPREGASGVAMASMTDTSGQAGAITSLKVSVSPAQVAPGGSVTITVDARDAQGRGVSGEKVKILATNGTTGAIQNRGGGSYTTTLNVSANATGDAMVVVTSADGSVSQAVPVPIATTLWGTDPNAGVATASDTATLTDPATVTPPVVKEPKAPRDPGDYPNGRVRVSALFGNYAYTQTPTDVDSALWDDRIGIESIMGGFEADAYGFLPMLPYVGAEAHFRMGFYNIQWPGAAEGSPAINDQVPRLTVNAIGRLPFALGSNQLHIGARVGYLYGDFITYQQDPSNDGLLYDSVPLIGGWTVGGEFGAQFNSRAHMRAVYALGFNQTNTYDNSVMVDLGVRPVADLPLSVVGSFQWSDRSIEVVAADADGGLIQVGELADSQLIGTLGLAYEF
ncbi:MAG: hypothetical protein ACI9VR_000654 [Cognaticolwellia sp.]|jgi:hypothetical protein